jgi:heat shock protein HslJ
MNIVPTILISFLILAGMILTACVSEVAPTILNGVSWKLVSFGPVGKQMPAATGIETSLTFGRDGQVSGMLGCNIIGGNYKVMNGNIIFNEIVSTLMACAEPLMAQEGTAFQVLNGTVRFSIDRDYLTIYDASGMNAITLSR